MLINLTRLIFILVHLKLLTFIIVATGICMSIKNIKNKYPNKKLKEISFPTSL